MPLVGGHERRLVLLPGAAGDELVVGCPPSRQHQQQGGDRYGPTQGAFHDGIFFLFFHNGLVSHLLVPTRSQILNQSVTHTFLMRKTSRATIFSGRDIITIRKNCIRQYWTRFMFRYSRGLNFLNSLWITKAATVM